MFLEEGQIVTTRGRDSVIDEEIQAVQGSILPADCPIAVLVNENSASASEILAACLKDRERAIVVGMRSYGKGSVQNVIPLEGGRAAMRLTTAYYYPPSGQRIHRRDPKSSQGQWGVDPSPGCEVDLTLEQLEATVERFRNRSQPKDDSPGEVQQGDPSIDVDPQLKFAFDKLTEALAEKGR
jgi:carboxyl-terminal processing protease